MPSRLKDARDQIATDFEALTPPNNSRRTYRKLKGRDVLDGASGHRTFYFLPPSAAVLAEFGSGFSVYQYEFEARVRISTAATGIDATFDSVVDESLLLVDAVNNRSAWPSGVRLVASAGYGVTETDSDDLEIILPITAEIEEAN